MQRHTNRLGLTSLSLSVAPLAIALTLAGCGSDQKAPEEPDGPMEKAGEKVDEGAEDAAEATEEAVDDKDAE